MSTPREKKAPKIKGKNATDIARSVEGIIRDGRMDPGDALPPVRNLASQLGVSPTTVNAAYRSLRTRGLLVAGGRQGTRVSAAPPVLRRLTTTIPSGVLDLANDGPDSTQVPAPGPVLAGLDWSRPLLEEGNEKELVEIASAAFAEDNIKCDAPALLGSLSAALERVMDAHLSFGDAVVVEDPCPTEVLDLCRTLGLNPVAVPVDSQGPLAEPFAAAVKTRVRGVIVSSRAQNPTSAAISAKRAKLLKKALTAHPDIFLIEYDPLGSSAGVPLVSIRDNQRTNYASIRTLGYVLGSAASMAAVAGDKETLGRIEGRLRVGGQVVNPILQRTLIGFCEPEHRILQEAVEETYEARREALVEALNACGIECWGTSGNYVWVPVPEEYPVAQSLRDAGWAVTPGERFRLQTGPGIRIVTASLPEERAEHLARDLQTILQQS